MVFGLNATLPCNQNIILIMKKNLIFIAAILLFSNNSNAQFEKLLCKIKSKKTEEKSTITSNSDEPIKKKESSKKSGDFSTVWETQFENKAENIGMVSSDGIIVIGSDENSASALDSDRKPLYNDNYKKMNTDKINKYKKQFAVFKDGGGYLFLFDSRTLGKDRVAVLT